MPDDGGEPARRRPASALIARPQRRGRPDRPPPWRAVLDRRRGADLDRRLARPIGAWPSPSTPAARSRARCAPTSTSAAARRPARRPAGSATRLRLYRIVPADGRPLKGAPDVEDLRALGGDHVDRAPVPPPPAEGGAGAGGESSVADAKPPARSPPPTSPPGALLRAALPSPRGEGRAAARRSSPACIAGWRAAASASRRGSTCTA